jgi:hypothetical protein
MAYIEYADKYLPGEVYRSTYGAASTNPFYKVLAQAKKNVKFYPDEQDTMSGESFQRFLNLQRNPSSLYSEAVKYPKGFNQYMSLVQEFGLNPGSV